MPSLHRSRPARRACAAALLTLIALAPLGFGGCSSSGSTSIEERRSRFEIDPESYAKLGYRRDWTAFPFVGGGESVQFVDAYPDLIIVQETGDTLTALEASNGAQRWTYDPTSATTQFVGNVRDGNRLISSSQAEAFILDTETGNLLDRQPFTRVVRTEPVLAGNLAIYGTGSGELLAHLLTTGGVRGVKAWGNMLSGSIEFSPVRVGNAVAAVSQAGDVIFVEAASGSLLGRTRVFAGRTGAIAAPLASTDSLLFVASLDQSLYAFGIDGRQAWRYRTPLPLRWQPVAHADTVYCAFADKGLLAFESATGREKWAAKGVQGYVVALRQGRLIVWDGTTAHVVDPRSGSVFERVPLPGVSVLTFDTFEDGNLYATSREGVVAKFVTR